mmetsp:Transcript_71950/g.208426  ORF Transcript_71950/g.208426 Transcript_71950/m.208426 type:complete len:265 (+) Transcript_71950:178-972(+)
MHIAAALDLQFTRRGRPSLATAGVGNVPRGGWSLFCCPGAAELWGRRPLPWCLAGVVFGLAVLCMGMFEAQRLKTHVLRSPCMVVGSEVFDVGVCTLCDLEDPLLCEEHPIASARLAVTFKPRHGGENITGTVWYCKERGDSNLCRRDRRSFDQRDLDAVTVGAGAPAAPLGGAPFPCTLGEVFAFMQLHAWEGEERQCYYSSRDTKGEDVWFSMPSPDLVDHAWFQRHFGYSLLLAMGGLILSLLLLACLAVEGVELWAAGIV